MRSLVTKIIRNFINEIAHNSWESVGLSPLKTSRSIWGSSVRIMYLLKRKKRCCHFKPKAVGDPYFKTRATPQTPALGFTLGNEDEQPGINQNIAFHQRVLLEPQWRHD